MSKIKYRDVRLSKTNIEKLDIINGIIEEYQEQDLILTLRQLFYQLVSRDIIPNKQSEYSKLSTLLKEGRMGGIVDWSAIEDRLRRPSVPSSFDSPADGIKALLNQYERPRMAGQTTYIEVWVEKDALSGVLSRVTEQYHVPILVNRGYSSASAMFDAYTRFKRALRDIEKSLSDEVDNGQEPNIVILYLGDFDPSGMDMIRDVEERIREFAERDFDVFPLIVLPIALTKTQIKKYNPPPNPAKRTDPRAAAFIAKHGSTSWEVDALPPNVLNKLLETSIKNHIDIGKYEEIVSLEEEDRQKLEEIIEKL